MLVTPLPMVTLVSPVHSEKAEFPMLVTLSGMVILVNPVHPRKAESPMLVTGFELYSDGIIISLSSQVPMPVTIYPLLSLLKEYSSPTLACLSPQVVQTPF